MRQIIIAKNPLIKELSGSRIRFFHPAPEKAEGDQIVGLDKVILLGAKANRVVIPFSVKILSGGNLDMDFLVSEELAKYGVSLVGAYWHEDSVTAYLMPLDGTDVHLDVNVPIMTGTLVQVTTYRQVEEGILGGTLIGGDKGVATVKKTVEKKRKPRRK